jgi:hypothetical protein
MNAAMQPLQRCHCSGGPVVIGIRWRGLSPARTASWGCIAESANDKAAAG